VQDAACQAHASNEWDDHNHISKVTLFLFLKDEMRLSKGRRVTLTSRILHSSMSSNRIHSREEGQYCWLFRPEAHVLTPVGVFQVVVLCREVWCCETAWSGRLRRVVCIDKACFYHRLDETRTGLSQCFFPHRRLQDVTRKRHEI